MQVAQAGKRPPLGLAKALPMFLRRRRLAVKDRSDLRPRAGGNPRILMPAYVNSPEHNSCRNASHGGRGKSVRFGG